MSLAQKCMLIDLHLSRWAGTKLDRKASKRLTEDASAQSDSAVVSKRLVPPSAFVNIVTASNALRAHVVRHTLPWTDNGQRIMTRNIYDMFMTRYGELERAYNDAVEDFIHVRYPEARDQAEFRLGDLFVESDYPVPEALHTKFGVALDIDGITEPDDFRVDLPEQELAKVREGLEESIKRRLDSAMQDVWQRIASVLEHYIEKIGEPDALFRDSTVNHLVELMNILPGLNVTNDPHMRDIRKRIRETLGSLEPNDLRKNADVRATAAQQAREIRETINEHLN